MSRTGGDTGLHDPPAPLVGCPRATPGATEERGRNGNEDRGDEDLRDQHQPEALRIAEELAGAEA